MDCLDEVVHPTSYFWCDEGLGMMFGSSIECKLGVL